MIGYFATLAAHNRWANRRLYDAVADLPGERFAEPAGVAFGSLRGTLNHLLVADRIWLGRITGEGDAPGPLDAVLHERLDDLRTAREAEDGRMIAVVEGLDGDALGRVLRYRTTSGAEQADPLALVLGHVFAHHAHHRGQAHALLTRFGHTGPALDLIYYIREFRAP